MPSWTNSKLPVPPDIDALRAGRVHGQRLRTPIPRSAQVPPFWEFKPPSGVDFYASMTGTLAAAVGATLLLDPSVNGNPIGPVIRLTPDYEGVVQTVNIFIDAITTAWNASFSLLANGAPVQGWANLTSFPRNANSINIPFNGPLQIPPNTLLQVLVTNNAATGPWTVGAQVAGWSWPTVDRMETFGDNR